MMERPTRDEYKIGQEVRVYDRYARGYRSGQGTVGHITKIGRKLITVMDAGDDRWPQEWVFRIENQTINHPDSTAHFRTVHQAAMELLRSDAQKVLRAYDVEIGRYTDNDWTTDQLTKLAFAVAEIRGPLPEVNR